MDFIAETSLSKSGPEYLVMRLPAVLGKPLREKGYNRVKVYLTDEGILLKPFISNGEIELPEWGNE